MAILRFDDIHRAYTRGKDVLKGVTLSIEPGEVVSLLGRNGAGKTTLLNIAMGILEPQKGSVNIFGLDPRKRPLDVKRRIGYLSEDQILPYFLTVNEIIDLHRGLYLNWDDDMAGDLIRRFRIPMGKKVGKLSKGQARQVALLCAVAHRPEFLLLDEPAGGLDPAARREFLETSIRILNEAGSTILFSTHYMGDVERLANRVVMLHEGKILIDSDLDRLHENYSLALVPSEGKVSREDLLKMDECVSVRDRLDSLHAVFSLRPEEACAQLKGRLGIDGVRCRTVALEELFIEILGGEL